MTKAIDWAFDLPLQSDEELRLFVRKAWGVQIPDVQVCPNHTTPWRAFADAYFARDSVSVWKASRGLGGKSYLLALLGLTEAATLKANVNILGGSGEQSENVHNYCQAFWGYESAPSGLLVSDPARRHTQLAWGNAIKALTASQRSVRGPHPQRLRLDEIDEMDLAIFDAAMGQTMEGDTGIAAQTVASSTHQYADGTMTEVIKRAEEKGWPVYEWCYKETMQGWLTEAEVERKRGEVTAAMWQVEYDLQEPSPEDRAIQPDAVEAMFRIGLGEFDGNNGEYIEAEAPVWNGEYVTGADWAKSQDWTIIFTIRHDVTPARVVAFERLGRRPWPAMIARFDWQVRRFPGRAAHDKTGLGTVVDDLLEDDALGVIMAGRARSDMLTNYIAAIEGGHLISPKIQFMYHEHRFASVNDVYGSGHLPDTIAAGAVAWLAIGRPGLEMGYDPRLSEGYRG